MYKEKNLINLKRKGTTAIWFRRSNLLLIAKLGQLFPIIVLRDMHNVFPFSSSIMFKCICVWKRYTLRGSQFIHIYSSVLTIFFFRVRGSVNISCIQRRYQIRTIFWALRLLFNDFLFVLFFVSLSLIMSNSKTFFFFFTF